MRGFYEVTPCGIRQPWMGLLDRTVGAVGTEVVGCRQPSAAPGLRCGLERQRP
jgi:hypothetical protein